MSTNAHQTMTRLEALAEWELSAALIVLPSDVSQRARDARREAMRPEETGRTRGMYRVTMINGRRILTYATSAGDAIDEVCRDWPLADRETVRSVEPITPPEYMTEA